MIKEINFDMDGTLVDFYSVANWLDYLINSDSFPYRVAKPLINMNSFARIVNHLRKNGYVINIISWTSKNGSLDFNREVAEEKRKWLSKHLASVHFDNIIIIPYGEPKRNYGKGILFDDELKNRNDWIGQSFDETNILENLKDLLR